MLAMAAMPVAGADDHRARINYTLHCQGCHLADATGLQNEVPRIKDFVAYFLHSPAGRDFLIQVPGVATSSLADDQLAELMNWLVVTYSKAQLPRSFEPYSVTEVAALRGNLEPDPGAARMRILRDIARELPTLAKQLEEEKSR